MRVFRRVFIEIDKNGKKEILLPGYILYAKIDGKVIMCKLHMIKSDMVYDMYNRHEVFTPYVEYIVDNKEIYKEVTAKNIKDGYSYREKDGININLEIRSEYLILADDFKGETPHTIVPGDKCYLAEVEYLNHDIYSSFAPHPCKFVGANDLTANFVTLDSNIPITIDYRKDNRYLVLYYPD